MLQKHHVIQKNSQIVSSSKFQIVEKTTFKTQSREISFRLYNCYTTIDKPSHFKPRLVQARKGNNRKQLRTRLVKSFIRTRSNQHIYSLIIRDVKDLHLLYNSINLEQSKNFKWFEVKRRRRMLIQTRSP